jgi:hypothetical protein
MNVSEPEADTEYSRAEGPSDGRRGTAGGRLTGGSDRTGVAVLGAGLAGAVVLLAAEFTSLFTVRSSAHGRVIDTVMTGSHHSYALLLIAVLAAGMSVTGLRSGSRPAALAIGMLGVAALIIALGHDLPDARASGLMRRADGTYVSIAGSPAVGLYLETLGGVVLLITAAAGALLRSGAAVGAAERTSISRARRSAS